MNVPSVPVLSEFQYRISSIFGYSVRYLVRDLAPCLLRLDPTLSRTTSNGSGRTRAGLHRSHATYGNGEFLQWLLDRGITPYMRTRDSALRKNNPGYGPERFTYLPESNTYGCPAGELLNYVGFERSQSRPCLYREREALRSLLTESTMYDRTLRISRHSHPRVGTTTSTGLGEHAEFARAQRQRKKVEALFAELACAWRWIMFVLEMFCLGAVAHNIKRLVRFLGSDSTEGSHHLKLRKTKLSRTTPARTKAVQAPSFSTATPVYNSQSLVLNSHLS